MRTTRSDTANNNPAVLPTAVSEARLAHPNPHTCAHCTNRATLRLSLATGEQVTVCRPHATRYPR
jgi:hypothetical protein